MHTDWVQERYSNAFVVGLPDSGVFLHRNDDRCSVPYADLMKWVFTRQNGTAGVNQYCLNHYLENDNEENAYQCLFSQFSLQYSKTPIFLLQSKFDSWSLANIYCSPSTDVDAANDLGASMVDVIKQVTSDPNTHVEGFVDGCFHHCSAVDDVSTKISSDKISQALRTVKAISYNYNQNQNQIQNQNQAQNLEGSKNVDTWNVFHSKETETLPIETQQSLFASWYNQQEGKITSTVSYCYIEEATYQCSECCQ